MNVLKGLKPEARRLLTEAFRRGEQLAVDGAEYEVDLKADLGREIDLAPLRVVIDEAMRRFDDEWLQSDAWLAPRVHATLRLTRREAADKRLWSYLNIVEFADYTRRRWSNEDGTEAVTMDRFSGEDGKGALARLWWGAELTRNGTSYDRSKTVLSNSRFYVSWLHLNLAHHRPATLAVADFLTQFGGGGATDTQGQIMAKAVNLALSTVNLDSLAMNSQPDAHAVREWLSEKFDVTTMLDDLPVGPDEAPVPEGDIAKVRAFLDELAVRVKLAEAKPRKKGRAVAV